MFKDDYLIAYVDGSASPNPGDIGSATHGYIYKDGPSKVEYDFYDSILTTEGYIHSTSYIGSDNIPVEPIYFIEQNESHNVIASNNVAELFAMKQILDWVDRTSSFKSILIMSDSSYVVNGINDYHEAWIENEWLRKDGKEISNKDIWKSLIEVYNRVKEKTPNITIRWLKGHSSHLGNQLADYGSKIARYNSCNKIYQYKEAVVPSKEYFNNKIVFNPLLAFNDILISNNKDQNEKGIYYLYKSDLEDHLIGKANSQTSYAIVYLKEPESIIEELKLRQIEAYKYDALLLAKMDKLKVKNYYGRIKNSVFNSLMATNNNNLLALSNPYKESNTFNSSNTDAVTVEINPPQLLSRAIDRYTFLYELLFSIVKDEKLSYCDNFIIDITNRFYQPTKVKGGKESLKLLDEFNVGFKNISLLIKIKDKDVKIPAVLGLDMPDRNTLKRIEDKSPSIKLVVFNGTNEAFSYCVFIQTIDGYSVWHNYNSSRIFF